MNEKVAKALRKAIYGDMSLKVERVYKRGNNGGLVEIGLRGKYQNAKKFLK